MKQYNNIWIKKKIPLHYKSAFPQKVLTLLKERGAKKILDLGSGEGSNLLLLSTLGFEPFGIEISKVGVKKTEEMAKKEQRNIVVLQRDIFTPLPFQDNSFDAVFSFQALNHNQLTNILLLFQEVNRILKHGGIFSIKTADRESYNLKKIKQGIYLDTDSHETFKFLDEQTYVPLDGNEKGLIHYTFYKDQLHEEVSKCGFQLIECYKTKRHILSTFEKY